MDTFESRILDRYPSRMRMQFAESLISVYDPNAIDEMRMAVAHYWTSMTVNTKDFIAFRRMLINRQHEKREAEIKRQIEFMEKYRPAR